MRQELRNGRVSMQRVTDCVQYDQNGGNLEQIDFQSLVGMCAFSNMSTPPHQLRSLGQDIQNRKFPWNILTNSSQARPEIQKLIQITNKFAIFLDRLGKKRSLDVNESTEVGSPAEHHLFQNSLMSAHNYGERKMSILL